MKRAFNVAWFGAFGLAAVVLGGCPIYSDSHNDRVCDSNACYDCPSSDMSGECLPWQCGSSDDCPSDYTCNSYSRCQPSGTTNPPPGTSCTSPAGCPTGQTCGSDDTCHTADCSVVSCPSNYQCVLSGGKATCQPRGGAPDASTDSSTPTFECNSDAQCASKGPGAKCLDGTCVLPADQCTDSTQCGSAQCVDGVCTPGCSATKPCPTGYKCDDTRGVCSQNPTPCTSTTQCSNGTTCVSGHCVDSCPATKCATGSVCVNGGCIPEQRPTFACNKDGAKPEGAQDACQSGSICLRRSCYITCSTDAGADAGGACRSADAFNVCKAVPTSSGTFAVCSTATGLGNECSPTGKACDASKICIDGVCR